jgi:capsular polysaccharide biosynthesis protein
MKLDKVILINTLSSEGNYCHWLRDHLIRFSYLNKLNINYSEYTLVSSFSNFSYQQFSHEKLNDLGFNFKNYLSTKEVNHFSANELIIPPYLTSAFNADYLGFLKSEFQFLQKVFMQSPKKVKQSDRVFLSRRNSNRTSEDEAKLISILVSNYNFTEIFLEEYNVCEQAAIFREAKVIIGLHGAGFTNISFCTQKTKILEIFSPNYIVTDFWDIACQLGLEYSAYSDDNYFKNLGSYRLCREDSIRFDIDKITQFIKETIL